MVMRTSLDTSWRDWLILNLRRGCAHSSLIADMVREGYEPEFTRSIVAQLANDATAQPQQSPAEPEAAAVPPGFTYEPSRLAGTNTIQTSDREVRVIARITKPDVIVFSNLLCPEECDELVRLSRPKIERSKTVDPQTGESVVYDHRTSKGTFFQLNQTDFIARLDRRLAEVTNWPVENGEGMQIINYGVGAEYRPHFDYFPPNSPGSKKILMQGGQRIATLIVYLNDVEDGGATIFPEIGLSILPRKGQAVYFSYFNSLGQVNPMTLHGGTPVIKGEKWIATRWMRQRPPV
ncbi:MAG: 2OG-Fe(II) oxygenase [Planctomycetota bacterium]